MPYLAVITFCLAFLTGCATIPEEQCASVDWFELGVKDGRTGYAPERLQQHREACAGVKVVPDEKRYVEGRRLGIAEYCRPENAAREGLAERTYRGVCDLTWERVYRAASSVSSLRRRIQSNQDEVSRKETELRDKKTSDSRRNELRSEIRELDRRRESLRDDLFAAERELDRLTSGAGKAW